MALTATEALHAVRKMVGRWIAGGATIEESMAGIVRVIMDVNESKPAGNEAELLMIIKEKDRLIQSLRSSRSGQAEAWAAVVNTLNEVVPDWLSNSGSASSLETAVKTIRKLAAYRPASYPATPVGADLRFDQTGRRDVVDQNGNDGLHYLPHGLTWEDAPAWATVLVSATYSEVLVWAARYLEHCDEPLRARKAIQIPGEPSFDGDTIKYGDGHNWTLVAVRPKPIAEA